jgi:hypothetical protein
MRTRKIRRGDDKDAFDQEQIDSMTAVQRMELSWEITIALYRQRGSDVSTQRLDRTVTNVQRRER